MTTSPLLSQVSSTGSRAPLPLLSELSLECRAFVQPLGAEDNWSDLGEGLVDITSAGHLRVIKINDSLASQTALNMSKKASDDDDVTSDSHEESPRVAVDGTESTEEGEGKCSTKKEKKRPEKLTSTALQNQNARPFDVLLEDAITDATPFVGADSCIVWNSEEQSLSFCIHFSSDIAYSSTWSALHMLQGKDDIPPVAAIDFFIDFQMSYEERLKRPGADPKQVLARTADEFATALSCPERDPAASFASIDLSGSGKVEGWGYIERHCLASNFADNRHGGENSPWALANGRAVGCLLNLCHPELLEYLTMDDTYPKVLAALWTVSKEGDAIKGGTEDPLSIRGDTSSHASATAEPACPDAPDWAIPAELSALPNLSSLEGVVNRCLRLTQLRHLVLPRTGIEFSEQLLVFIDSFIERLRQDSVYMLVSNEDTFKSIAKTLISYGVIKDNSSSSVATAAAGPTTTSDPLSDGSPTDSASLGPTDTTQPSDLLDTAKPTTASSADGDTACRVLAANLRCLADIIQSAMEVLPKDVVIQLIGKVFWGTRLLEGLAAATLWLMRNRQALDSAAASANGSFRSLASVRNNNNTSSGESPTNATTALREQYFTVHNALMLVLDVTVVHLNVRGEEATLNDAIRNPISRRHSSDLLMKSGTTSESDLSRAREPSLRSSRLTAQMPISLTGAGPNASTEASVNIDALVAYLTVAPLMSQQTLAQLHPSAAAPQPGALASALSSTKLKGIAPRIPTGEPIFYLFHLLSMHDDEGTTIDRYNCETTNTDRDAFHEYFIKQHIAVLSQGRNRFTQQGGGGAISGMTSMSPSISLNIAPQNHNGTKMATTAASFLQQQEIHKATQLPPGFTNLCEYFVRLCCVENQKVALRHLLSPSSVVAGYLSATSVFTKQDLCANIRCLRSIVTTVGKICDAQTTVLPAVTHTNLASADLASSMQDSMSSLPPALRVASGGMPSANLNEAVQQTGLPQQAILPPLAVKNLLGRFLFEVDVFEPYLLYNQRHNARRSLRMHSPCLVTSTFLSMLDAVKAYTSLTQFRKALTLMHRSKLPADFTSFVDCEELQNLETMCTQAMGHGVGGVSSRASSAMLMTPPLSSLNLPTSIARSSSEKRKRRIVDMEMEGGAADADGGSPQPVEGDKAAKANSPVRSGSPAREGSTGSSGAKPMRIRSLFPNGRKEAALSPSKSGGASAGAKIDSGDLGETNSLSSSASSSSNPSPTHQGGDLTGSQGDDSDPLSNGVPKKTKLVMKRRFSDDDSLSPPVSPKTGPKKPAPPAKNGSASSRGLRRRSSSTKKSATNSTNSAA